jgi:hypothetical protein
MSSVVPSTQSPIVQQRTSKTLKRASNFEWKSQRQAAHSWETKKQDESGVYVTVDVLWQPYPRNL